jgi:hypothetical protein
VNANKTCSQPRCRKPAFCRGLCRTDYDRQYRNRALPPRQLALPISGHSLTNVDREAKIADCFTCGVGVRIRLRNRGAQCTRSGRNRGPTARRRENLRRFGLGVEDYDAMLMHQDGGCAICRRPPDPSRRLAVDHCHATGRVRGLLCGTCNTALGQMRDDPELLRRAIEYLTA